MSFKASMANFYHEARADKRKIKALQEGQQRRAERRAEVAGQHTEHPLATMLLEGRPCKLHKNADMHAALERMDGLIAWNGQADCLIDRCVACTAASAPRLCLMVL